jgi:hypothetical protein
MGTPVKHRRLAHAKGHHFLVMTLDYMHAK